MSDLIEKLKKLNNTVDHTGEYVQNDIQENRVMAILCYLSWLILIPLICARKSGFARFHINQGLMLAIAETVVGLILGKLSSIALIGWIFGIVNAVLSIAFIIAAVIGILNALSGRAKELPIVGKYKIL